MHHSPEAICVHLQPEESTNVSNLESLLLRVTRHAGGSGLDLASVEAIGVKGVLLKDVG